MARKVRTDSGVKTLIKSTGLGNFGECANMAVVDVKDGKILRFRPFPYTWKYKPEEFNPWKITARGQVFEAPLKSLLVPFTLGYKKRIYSPNRILYPMKRVDWNSDGDRNPQNRGISKYVRVSWDEATDIIVKEIKRVVKKYGPEAVLLQADGHGEEKVVHSAHGCSIRLMRLLGGFTQQVRNPDSWEGWYFGAKHVWGMEPWGLMTAHQTNLYSDIAKHTGMLLCWSCDPETTSKAYAGGGQMVPRLCYWYSELGIKTIYICPDVNYGAAVHADKWIPILPNTDAAMQLAIAYTWITEGTYDKKYIATHSVGFDKFEEYVLGKEDGIPKTPKWASEKCGVPSRIIKALAREWASKATTLQHGSGGPFVRGAFSTEPARLEILLLAMQGLGKPGAHHLTHEFTFIACRFMNRMVYAMTPGAIVRPFPQAAYRGYCPADPLAKQIIPKTMIHDAILNGHFEIYGSSHQNAPVEDQFKKYVYPVPGCSPVHMIWTDTPCLMTCWNDSNRIAEAYRHDSIEFILAQHPWMENDCLFADVILPVNTKFEEDDIGADTINLHFDTIFISDKCVEPVGESKSDYEAVCAIAEKFGLLKEYTEGKSVDEWIKYGFDTSGVPEAGLTNWEELQEKRYYVIPTDPEWEKRPAGLITFHDDPEKDPLTTPSGKIEFYSERLARHFPDDKERPPVPHWVENSDYHNERLSSDRAKKYPLLCMSNHPRHRVHAQMDDCDWFREINTCKVKGPDGYMYEPVWINLADASSRGIKDGDIVKIFNERGGVLLGAYITERIMPGVVGVDHGARYDPIVVGELDKGGAINTICPHNITSKNCPGMVTNGFLVEVELANLDELRKQYPEAFGRPYDQASGLCLEQFLERAEW